MCSFTKKLQLLGDFVPQTPYRGSAPGPRWGTSIPQTPSLILCLPNPVRLTPLHLAHRMHTEHLQQHSVIYLKQTFIPIDHVV